MVAHEVNGEPGIVAVRSGRVAAVLALTVREGAITRVYVVADPRKLAQVKRVRDHQATGGSR